MCTYNSNIKKLLGKPLNLIKNIIDSVHKLSPIKNDFYKRNIKYTLEDYIIGILDVLKNYQSWNSYNGKVNGNTLRKKYNEWVKLGVFEDVYKSSLNKYLKNTKITEELKYQSIDSTFIEDINGSKYASYSGIYKRRKGESSKGIKITSIVTTKGIPISVSINTAKNYDSPILPKAIKNIVINCNTKKYSNHNRFKQYFLADSGYDSKNNIKIVSKLGYTPIIKYNKKNTKNEKLMRPFNEKQKKIYKKRNIIENYHSWLKKFIKIKCLYEHKIDYYRGLLLLGISIIIHRRINKNKS